MASKKKAKAKAKKSSLKQHTISFYDWNEIEDEIHKRSGKSIRNWAGKKYDSANDDAEYLDFWHFLAENGEISRGAIVTCNFAEEREDIRKGVEADDFGYSDAGKWLLEIYDLLVAILGEKEVNVRFDW